MVVRNMLYRSNTLINGDTFQCHCGGQLGNRFSREMNVRTWSTWGEISIAVFDCETQRVHCFGKKSLTLIMLFHKQRIEVLLFWVQKQSLSPGWWFGASLFSFTFPIYWTFLTFHHPNWCSYFSGRDRCTKNLSEHLLRWHDQKKNNANAAWNLRYAGIDH